MSEGHGRPCIIRRHLTLVHAISSLVHAIPSLIRPYPSLLRRRPSKGRSRRSEGWRHPCDGRRHPCEGTRHLRVEIRRPCEGIRRPIGKIHRPSVGSGRRQRRAAGRMAAARAPTSHARVPVEDNSTFRETISARSARNRDSRREGFSEGDKRWHSPSGAFRAGRFAMTAIVRPRERRKNSHVHHHVDTEQGVCPGERAGPHGRHGEALPERIVHARERHVHDGEPRPGLPGPGRRSHRPGRGARQHQGCGHGVARSRNEGDPASAGLPALPSRDVQHRERAAR
jgi:hypothetical protein